MISGVFSAFVLIKDKDNEKTEFRALIAPLKVRSIPVDR